MRKRAKEGERETDRDREAKRRWWDSKTQSYEEIKRRERLRRKNNERGRVT